MLRRRFIRFDTLGGRFRIPVRLLILLAGCVGVGGPLVSPARAQLEQNVPSFGYQAAFADFYEGQYEDALRQFRSEGNGAIKIGMVRWIDSICYETMVGECYYQMGYLEEALGHYTAALKLASAYSEWMLRVQFRPAIQPAGTGTYTAVPWGASTRRTRLGFYPDSMPILRGQIDNNQPFREGGVVMLANLRPINVQEIVRCTTLAIRRRAQLLGPVSQHDPLFAELIAKLSRRPGPPNHWSEAWIDVQLGLVLIAGGREAQGVPYLQRAVMAAGEFDHPMTGIALVELGRLALARGDYASASGYFEEATYAAVHYPDLGVLEEAFRYGALTHLLANRKGVYPLLEGGIGWAKVKDLRHLYVSLLLSACENYAVLGQTPQAAGFLEEARLGIGRRQMAGGRIGARSSFLASLVLFQQKKIPEGDAMLAAAMNFMRRGSFWLYHIGLADGLYTSGTITSRVAVDLYDHVLRDPQPDDWAADPMESMAVLVIPHPLPIEHWFEAALSRKDNEKALEVADRARRHRFFSSLGFGGRLLSLRWILEAPPEVLDNRAQLTRQDLLARYPAYEALSRQSRALAQDLKAIPLVTEDPDLLRRQGEGLSQLAAVSLHQEALLREMAVRREPGGLVFPPLRTTQDVQKSLQPGQAILAFFATSRHLYGFLLNNQRYAYWQIGSPDTLLRQIPGLLRQMGHFQSNGELAIEDLADQQWKTTAAQTLDLLLKGSQADLTKDFDELVIVPDGVLWYLPFEALQVSVDGKLRPLISRFRIRYAPTTSLATWTGGGRSPTGNTGVVIGKLYPRDDETVAQAAFDQLTRVLPGTIALKSPPPAASNVYGSLLNRLIVFDDLTLSTQQPYGWTPMPLDNGKPGNFLADWLWLPWGAPNEIILPGYHTTAEDSLKRLDRTAPGHEVFLSACGLMASGCRTILLSRWRTGGRTSFDLVREFAQELPHIAPSEAWQRSVFLAAASQLEPDQEPRLKRTTDEAPRASHPFFWAGYMLIDSGTAPRVPEGPPVQPVLQPKEPARAVQIPAPPG